MALSQALEIHFTAYLILLYICFPVVMLLLRHFLFNNIPVKDIFWLLSALICYTSAIWYVVLLGTDLYCPDDCVATEECSKPEECRHFGGLNRSWTNMIALVLAPIFAFACTLILEPLYAFRCTACSKKHAFLPIDFEPTPVSEMRDLIRRIEKTGPTLVAGVVEETGCIKNQNGGKTRYWGLVAWDQFRYDSWAMKDTLYPYFDKEQDRDFAFSDLEEVFGHSGPVIIKASLDVEASNERTRQKYEAWRQRTTGGIKGEAKEHSSKKLKKFYENLVTDDPLWDWHTPNRFLPSIQLPSLLTTKESLDDMEDRSEAIGISNHNMMIAKHRYYKKNL